MSQEAVRELSIPELLRLLGAKLDEEYSQLREIALSSGTSPATPLDSEIKSLEDRAYDRLSSLRSLRNVLRPVNRLPQEVISCVARCVLEKNAIDTASIVPLTHVCRYWRDSIVSTPENWTLISSKRMELAKLSLERAKAAPLAVLLAFVPEREFVDLLLPRARNIVSFTCVGFNQIENLVRTLPDFPKSMPNLRSLQLNESGLLQEGARLPADPFDFSAHTSLKELTLIQVPLLPSILSLRTLTEFNIFYRDFRLHVDTLFSFMEENHQLEVARLEIGFHQNDLYLSQRPTPGRNRLQRLEIMGRRAEDIRALIPGIALQKGGVLALKIYRADRYTGLAEILSGLSTAHHPSLSSSTLMVYQDKPRKIQLFGPGGSFSYNNDNPSESPFGGCTLLPLASVQELRLKCSESMHLKEHLPCFSSLEVLAIRDCSSRSPHRLVSSRPILSPMLPDPSSPPFLKTLLLQDCAITEEFMFHIKLIALHHRRNNLPASPHRLIIADSRGQPPSAAYIEWLRDYVPVVEVLEGSQFPEVLSLSSLV